MTTALYDYEGAVLLIIYSYRGGHVTSLVCPFVGWVCLKIPLAVEFFNFLKQKWLHCTMFSQISTITNWYEKR